MDLKMSLTANKLQKIHIPVVLMVLIWINNVGVIKASNSFTSNSEIFGSVPTTIKTTENDTVLLPCNPVVPFQFVRWLRDDVAIVDSRHPELFPPPRITLFTNGSLQVREVQRNDTAEYLCEVMTASHVPETQLHAIEVQYPPNVISTPSGRIEVKLGSVFEIVCEARGIPYPIISWRQNEHSSSTQLENNRRKLIEVSDRSMAGKIECIATNGVGQPAVAGVDMVVYFTPEIKALVGIVHTKMLQNAQLECLVTSQPVANLHWFNQGIPVITNDRIKQYNQTNQTTTNEYHDVRKHILLIKNIKESDFGMYECRAENAIGFNGAKIELTGRPMTPIFKRSPIASDPMAHNLIWQTESLSPIYEHVLKFRKIPSGNVTPLNRKHASGWHEIIVPSSDISEGPIHSTGYTLRGLEPASVYEVAVMARNRFGLSNSSAIVRFATSGEIELPNYSTESTDEENYEQSYYDDSSSSAMEPQSTIDGADPYDSYSPFGDPYSRSASTNSEKYILLFTIIGLLIFYRQ